MPAPKKKTAARKAPAVARAVTKASTKAATKAAAKPATKSATRRPKSAVATRPARKRAAPAAAAAPSLEKIVVDALADMKALEIKVLDVRGLTDIVDYMIIASGTSDRHVRSVAQRVVEKTKAAGYRPHGVEGQQDSDWVLIDLNDMIVHVMLPRVREFYGLEKLWDMTVTKRAALTRAASP